MMNRTLETGLLVWRKRGIHWGFRLGFAAIANKTRGLPRGLIVEPTTECTGNCSGCRDSGGSVVMDPRHLEGFLTKRGTSPVTIHFSGKHSDPLASPLLPELVSTALKRSSMVSVSSIGLGLRPGWEFLPVDRWILSIPAAGRESWKELRGTDRLEEFRENLRRMIRTGRSLIEVVLTLWRPSEGDGEAFRDLMEKEGVRYYRTVFGRYDPQGHHLGTVKNLVLQHPDSPWKLENGEPVLKNAPKECPLKGTVFLDAGGMLHPCPFVEAFAEDPSMVEGKQTRREYPECRICP